MNYQEISDFVDAHQNEAITFLQSLLRIPSPTGEEKAVAEFIASKLRTEGFNPTFECADPDRPNLLNTWKGGEGKTLLFNGHMDVFPPEASPARDPWSGEIVGDRIYARGATDMKAGDAAAIMAICFLKRMGFVPQGTIDLGLNCDEEQGGRAGILHCISKGLLKADFTICMEASEDTVIVDTDGRIAYKITFKSDGWHAGTRLNQEDALMKAHKAVSAVIAYDKKLLAERYWGGNDFGACISVTSASAGYEGKTVNMHPAICTIWVDRRYTKGETVESAEAELREVLDSVEGLKGSYTLETLFASQRLTMDPNDPDIVACIDAYKTVFNSPIRAGRRNAGGDAVKLAHAYNQKVPHFGPGVYDVLGSDDEYVPINQYLGFIKTYMLFASRYFN